ncbi:MAG: hypothetical protein HAW62_04930 [Endozoicomonadaceae bacterium]|nr:hypothetical protein [Endozoicomonadaceae bacterium]
MKYPAYIFQLIFMSLFIFHGAIVVGSDQITSNRQSISVRIGELDAILPFHIKSYESVMNKSVNFFFKRASISVATSLVMAAPGLLSASAVGVSAAAGFIASDSLAGLLMKETLDQGQGFDY